MKNYNRKFLLTAFFLMISLSVSAIERRKPQFSKESAYMILPTPYSLPGIGSGVMITGLAANIMDSYTDTFLIYSTGDIKGMFGGLMDLHLIDETLFFDIYVSDMSAQVNSYKYRGMVDGEDDYQILNAKKRTSQGVDATLSLFDRRFEILWEYSREEITMDKVLDEEGNTLIERNNPKPEESTFQAMTVRLDLTDDRQDPLKGVRLSASQKHSPRADDSAADYQVMDLDLSVYIPIGESHTWAFNYQTSEAMVNKKGDTNRDNIIREMGLDCSSYETCTESEQNLIDTYVTQRTYGSADSLGGDEKLRAYPMGRFQGAHSAYLATEFRWNFATDVVPFDFWIWKDIATGFQLAAFHEVGTVAESKADLWKESRPSTGLGFRMVSASGFVYRADFAVGDEGMQNTIMFNYPW